ncbi:MULTISPECIES: KAP family NTPase [Nostocales]|uniref:AAA family ATPase n=3 Tax=Nostocales TaxID=1161 RepID=A0A8S9TCA4_9CYAN|nr:P-loop NTPase fold protein [Tolypothrix bouteillei]KAF3889063.1 AAA family ATPase [Tolypothrix bouteillei VB521301]
MAQTEVNDLSQDTPLIKPEEDRLGYASFAKHLADSICKMDFPEGFAIAVYGSWNSGKSTLLNFVVHYLKQKPEDEQPIIVPFNPWLFSGHQDITRRFFDQLQDVLSAVTAVPKGLRERIADVAKAIAEIPLPYAQAGKAVASLVDDKQKEAPELKEDVEDTLTQQHRRIVITIDDIDRLCAEDIQQLFRLLKAIPNFTNVVYLLVCDKKSIIKSLADERGPSGEEYLDRIIQMAFEIPSPDKTSLRKLLFEKLNNIIGDTAKPLFEPTRWSQIYFQGIDYFITNLRDIVRLTDTLTVSFPVVEGEVNPVDFIALESLRVFCPLAYEIILKNRDAFIKSDLALENLTNFYNFWLAQLPEEDKQPVKNLLMFLFPKLEVIWGDYSVYSEQQKLEWQEKRRICCPENFPIYFCLNLSTSELSHTQIEAILSSACNAKAFGQKLIELSHQKRQDGTTQVRAFLEKLEDYAEKVIPNHCISLVIEALFDVGEELLSPEDGADTMFDFSNEVIIHRLLTQLLFRLDEPTRFDVLKTAMSQGKALSIIEIEIETLTNQQLSTPEEKCLISAQHLKVLQDVVAKRTQEKDVESINS